MVGKGNVMSLRPLVLMAALVGLALAVSACAGTSSAATGSTVTLRVGQTGWAVDQAALRVAGLADTPYTVTWPVFTGGDQELQALQGGALDVTSSSDIPPVFAAAAGAPTFRVVAVLRANTLLQEVVVGPDSPITSIAQLKGRTVGYVQNTTAQYFLVTLLAQAGLSWSDIKPAPLSPNDGVAALHSGAIAAFASYGNSIITAHQFGARTIGSGEDILSGDYEWEASTALLANAAKRADLADLLSRINRAYAYIRAGHEQAFAQATADATHETLASALSQLRSGEQQRPTTIVPTSQSAINAEQDVADVFSQLGAIPAKLDVSTFWTDELDADLTKALAK